MGEDEDDEEAVGIINNGFIDRECWCWCERAREVAILISVLLLWLPFSSSVSIFCEPLDEDDDDALAGFIILQRGIDGWSSTPALL